MRNVSSLVLATILATSWACAGGTPSKQQEETPVKKASSEEVKAALEVAISSSRAVEERKAAVEKLGRLGDPAAVIPLAALLDGSEGSSALEPDLRVALGQLSARTVLEGQLAGAEEEKLRALALLGLLGESASVDAILTQLRDPSVRVREKAAVVLGGFREARATSALVRALGDAEADVRSASAQSLGFHGGQEAIGALQAALGQEKDGFVKISIENALTEAKRRAG